MAVQHSPAVVVQHLQPTASAAEEVVFDALAALALPYIDQGSESGGHFKTTLLKTLLSSPMACLDTLRSHLHQLQRGRYLYTASEFRQLRALETQLSRIDPQAFTKYQRLLQWIAESRWTGADSKDRLIVCTERLETLFFLVDHLPRALGIAPAAVDALHAGIRMDKRKQIVNAFQNPFAPNRLLICADIASACLDLHPLSHRLVHFDIPWSATIIRQRNARIEYPQQPHTAHQAEIAYLGTHSRNPCINAKQSVLQSLILQQQYNIPAPPRPAISACIKETRITSATIERGSTRACARRHTLWGDWQPPGLSGFERLAV